MKPLNLYDAMVAKADLARKEENDSAWLSLVATSGVVVRSEPVRENMLEIGEKLARILSRCHDVFRRCTKYHGPTGKPTYILEARGLWGPTSVRRWADIPCRACELEARDNHDPGDEGAASSSIVRSSMLHESDPSMMDGHRQHLARWRAVK